MYWGTSQIQKVPCRRLQKFGGGIQTVADVIPYQLIVALAELRQIHHPRVPEVRDISACTEVAVFCALLNDTSGGSCSPRLLIQIDMEFYLSLLRSAVSCSFQCVAVLSIHGFHLAQHAHIAFPLSTPPICMPVILIQEVAWLSWQFCLPPSSFLGDPAGLLVAVADSLQDYFSSIAIDLGKRPP